MMVPIDVVAGSDIGSRCYYINHPRKNTLITPERTAMTTRSLLFLRYACLPIVSFMVSATAIANEPRLGISTHTLAWGGSCDPGIAKVIAGSRFFIRVDNTADQPAQALIPGWPDGYILEAALDLPDQQPFTPTPGLIDRLQPARYLSIVNQMYEKDVLERRTSSVDLLGLNSKDFVLRIPSDLSGHTLTFRARFERNGLKLTSNLVGSISIIAPCDQNDTARIIATQIYEAWDMLDYRRAVAIADSMLETGLSDAAGWDWAESAARGCGEIDKAIAYLDRLFEDFGVVEVYDPSNPPRLNRHGPRNSEMQSAYEYMRNSLLRNKNEIDQQQQR